MHKTDLGFYSLTVVPGRGFRLPTWQTDPSAEPVAIGVVHLDEDGCGRLVAHASAHAERARAMAAELMASELAPELLGYLMALPEGSRPMLWDPEDGDAMDELAHAVRRALAAALSEGDPYRAARRFERQLQNGSPDVGLVRFFERRGADLTAEAVRRGLAEEAARRMQDEICGRSQLVRRHVRAMHDEAASMPPSRSP